MLVGQPHGHATVSCEEEVERGAGYKAYVVLVEASRVGRSGLGQRKASQGGQQASREKEPKEVIKRDEVRGEAVPGKGEE